MKPLRILPHRMLAALFPLLAACGKHEVSAPSNPTEMMPLKVGNAWMGRTSTADGTFTFDTLAVVADTAVGAEHWLVTGDGVRWINRGPALLQASRGSSEIRREAMMNVVEGDTFADHGTLPPIAGDSTRQGKYRVFSIVTSTHENVEILAGQFSGIKAVWHAVDEQGNEVPGPLGIGGYSVWVPGIGKVLEMAFNRGSDNQPVFRKKWELVNVEMK